MSEVEQKQHRSFQEKKDHRVIEGRRITQQLPCHPQPAKHKLKYDPPSKQSSQIDTFRTLLSRRDRQKESQSKLEHRQFKRAHDQIKEEKEKLKKEGSKSRSKSKALAKSKSLKQLVKKSKSMVRLEPRQDHHREERKSLSPQGHVKSTISYADRKHCKSNYNSKTTREMISQITTEREKSKSKLKLSKVLKKPKVEVVKKPAQNKINKKKTEKENIKLESKHKKGKKEKRVLISEEHSKVRRECEDWQLSLNDEEFLDPRHREVKQKQRSKNSNIVDIPKRKQRLSLNPSHPRKPSLKNKTEVQLENYKSQKKEIEEWAAIKIQKVFRGYLTRKYIRQCFEHNAAVKIQKVWRGFWSRKKCIRLRKQAIRQQFVNLSPLKMEQGKIRIFQQEDYLIEKQESKSILKNSFFNEKWAQILQQILEERSVSQHIKKKIELFLQVQQKSINQFELLQSNRSPSARSSISSQVIHNEMASERHFLEKQRMKKFKHNEYLFLSPKENMGHKGNHSSPQGQFCSPQHKFRSSSPARSSTELLISNLKSIQKAHRDRLQNKANDQKEQLNKMLIKNKLSPRTHEKKYKEVDMFLESELEKFNESINEIVKNCMLYGQDNEELLEDTIFTPKKELTQLPTPADISPHHQPVRGEEMSVEFREYYQARQEQTSQQVQRLQPFDSTYQFIEEYLISLIDFVRQYDNGSLVSKIISYAHKPISREMDTILRNLKHFTENSEEDQNQSSFQLPMYKYMDMEQEIIQNHLILEFNAIYPKLRINQLRVASSLQDSFVKMIADCMNEALNALRPHSYPFLESKLFSLNIFKGLDKISFDGQISEEEMQYQYICAQAMNQIFYWNKLQWGKIIRFQEDMQNFNETRHFLQREEETSIISIYAQENWVFYEELIEIIGIMGEELFEHIIFQEIETVFGVFFEWVEKIGRSAIKIEAPNNRTYFLP